MCSFFLLLNLESMSERVRVRASFGIGLSIGGFCGWNKSNSFFFRFVGGFEGGGISNSKISQAIANPQILLSNKYPML